MSIKSGLPPLRSMFKSSGVTTLTQADRARIARNKAKALQLQRFRSLGAAPLATRGFKALYGKSGEKKFFDINTGTIQVNTTGSFNLMFIPVLGSDYNNRIGRKTRAVSFYIRGRCQTEQAGTVGSTTIVAQQARLIVFIDLQPNGAAPSVTDLLNEALPSSQLNANNRDRFMILKDKIYYFGPYTKDVGFAAFENTGYNIKIYKKINMETIYNSTNGGTIADLSSGALYMFWIGSQTASGGGDANAIVSTRVRFIDY